MKFHSKHMAGEHIPADEGSRGFEIDNNKMQRFIKSYAIDIPTIRDGSDVGTDVNVVF